MTINTPEVAEGFRRWKTVFDEGLSPLDLSSGDCHQLMMEGKLATRMEGSWVYNFVRRAEPEVQQHLRIVPVPFPVPVGGGSNVIAMASEISDERKALVWDFIEIVTSQEWQEQFGVYVGNPAPRPGTMTDAIYEAVPHVDILLESQTTASENGIDRSPTGLQIVYNEFAKLVRDEAQRMIADDVDPAEVVASLQRPGRRIAERYVGFGLPPSVPPYQRGAEGRAILAFSGDPAGSPLHKPLMVNRDLPALELVEPRQPPTLWLPAAAAGCAADRRHHRLSHFVRHRSQLASASKSPGWGARARPSPCATTKNSSNPPNSFKAIWVTITLVAAVTILSYIIGLATALLVNQRFAGRKAARVLVALPWAVPSVMAAIIWWWLFDSSFGLINWALVRSGISAGMIPWLSTPGAAFFVIVVVMVWKGYPFISVIMLAGLQSIPLELYDAAKVDGANAWNRFRFITLPGLRSVRGIALILIMLWVFPRFSHHLPF